MVLFDDEEFQPLVEAMKQLTEMKKATFRGGLLFLGCFRYLSPHRDTGCTRRMD